jgi:hypothetical protein
MKDSKTKSEDSTRLGYTELSFLLSYILRQSRGVGQRLSGRVARTDAPVYMRERGGGGRGGCGLRSAISAVIRLRQTDPSAGIKKKQKN